MVRKAAAKRHKPSTPNVVDMKTGLELKQPRRRSNLRTFLIGVACIAALALGTYALWHVTARRAASQYETVAVVSGRLEVGVAATGSAHPVSQVNISSEISGTIQKVFVDHDQNVAAGQPLAELDTEKLAVAVDNAKAKLELARINAEEALSSLEERRIEYERKRGISTVISSRDLQAAAFAHDRAIARHQAAVASIELARTELRSAEITLSRATIRSPVSGTVLRRNAEVGQFIVVSLQAPVLFVIAKDLDQIEIRLDVKEADIDKMQIGQRVSFGVPTSPRNKHTGEVREIRVNSEVVKGDVVYKVILQVHNPGHVIRPGMSVSAEVFTGAIENAALLPNSAFVFSPSYLESAASALQRRFLPIVGADDLRSRERADRLRTVWVLSGGVPSPITVMVGATDGKLSELLGGSIAVGERVIVGTKSTAQ